MTLKIFYDGDCYFCSSYVKLLQLREAVGPVELVSLRDGGEEAERIRRKGYDLNSGFVVEHDGSPYFGSAAFIYLNGLLEPAGHFNRALAWISARTRLASVVYPILVAGRIALLALQGRALIDTRSAVSGRAAVAEPAGLRALRLAPLLLGLLYGVMLVVHLARGDGHPIKYVILACACLVFHWMLFANQMLGVRVYEKLRYGNAVSLASFVALWLVIINTPDLIVFRRFAGFIAALPLLGIAIELFQTYHRRRDVGLLPAAVPAALLVFCLWPGFIFPPFYGGIAGWTVTVDRSKPVNMSGVRLVNDAGQEIWLNPAFLQPHTQIGRFQLAYSSLRRGQENYLAFLFENYKRIYPILESGWLPHQRYLGRFAYPPHSLVKNNARDYVPDFRPDRVVALKYQKEAYRWDKTLLWRKDGTQYRTR